MINLAELTVGNILTRNAMSFPEKEAIIFEGKRITYGELNRRVNRLANALLDLGIKKGDKVSILFQNSNQFVEAYFAVAKIGGVAVSLNSRLSSKELLQNIDFSDSKMLIYSDVFSETVDSIRKDLSKIKNFIIDSMEKTSNTLNFEEIMKKNPETEPDLGIKESDGCELLFTGGTTGIAKGVFRTHHAVVWSGMLAFNDLRLTSNARILVTAPLFHVAALDDLMVGATLNGATMFVLRGFDPIKCLEGIRDERLDFAFFVPLMFQVIFMMPELGKYLGSMKIWGSAAAPMSVELRDKILSTFPDINLFEVFGQTENPWISVMYSHNNRERPESCGIPATCTVIRLVDDNDNEVPRGEVGEIVVQGPATMTEYYKNGKETKKTLKGGWLHTGDLGRFDEEGYLFIVDRKKDMIITGGENVYAVEVENVLINHPKIQEVAVIGLPDEIWGEKVTAVVVLAPNQEATEDEIIAFAKDNLTHYKCPKAVKFIDTLPKSSLFKILKQELREKYSESH
jgi:fatty-acyl-CoA synthase